MTSQSGGNLPGGPASGVLGGSYPSPTFATNGTTPILGTVSGSLGADVTMTNAGQFYDGPTVALTAGTWLLIGKGEVFNAAGVVGDQVGLAIRQGTTVIAGDDAMGMSGSTPARGIVYTVVTVASPLSYVLSAESARAGCAFKSASSYGLLQTGIFVSSLLALRIA